MRQIPATRMKVNVRTPCSRGGEKVTRGCCRDIAKKGTLQSKDERCLFINAGLISSILVDVRIVEYMISRYRMKFRRCIKKSGPLFLSEISDLDCVENDD
jgi:hypothetical protein